MANPPFNVDKVDKERLTNDPRFPLGLPKLDNANYCASRFSTAASTRGPRRLRDGELGRRCARHRVDFRRQLIEAGAVDVMVAVGRNLLHGDAAVYAVVPRRGKTV